MNDNDNFFVVKAVHSRESFLCESPADEVLQTGDFVVADTPYGPDLCEMLGPISDRSCSNWKEVRRLLRKATAADLRTFEGNREREIELNSVVAERIERYGLNMRLVSAHYMLEDGKALILFTAERRIDFRNLVRDLVSVLHTRVELRQIGVRDETRTLGGIGVCGRTLCCNSVSDRLNPVSIKMAKAQNLSLNSQKISGACGRLMCCLDYEYEFYRSERKNYPPLGTQIGEGNARMRVVDMNMVRGVVTTASPDGSQRSIPVRCFQKDGRSWSLSADDCPAMKPLEV